MPITHPNLHLTKLAGAIPAWSGEIKPDDLQPICQNVQDGGGRLVALWGSDDRTVGAATSTGSGQALAANRNRQQAGSYEKTSQKQSGFMLYVALVNENGLICLS